MRSILQSLKKVKSEVNTNRLKILLSQASNPMATLKAQQHLIDDIVVEAFNLNSFSQLKEKHFEQALLWSDIAHAASLLRGSAVSLANSLRWRAHLLIDLSNEVADTKEGAESAYSWNAAELREGALECARDALQIYEQAGMIEEIGPVLGLISVIHQATEQTLLAFRCRLMSLLEWSKLGDAHESMPQLFENLVALYWQLRDNDSQDGSQLLLEHTEALQSEAHQWLDEKRKADVYVILGEACWKTEREVEVLDLWEQAANLYHLAGVKDL